MMTLRQAKAQAKALRAAGKVVKIFKSSGVYTQPGRGIVAFETYYVEIVG